MKVRTIEYFVKEAFLSLNRNSLMSIASVSTVALSLLILGLFLVMVLNINHMASFLESQVQISVYISDSLSEKDIHEIGNSIAKIGGVQRVVYVSREQAMERFKERLGEQQGILNALGETNPLPNGFDVNVAAPEKVRPVAQAISELKVVESTRFGQEVVEHLFNLTKMVRLFGVVLIVFLALAAVFIISNTIRITVFARRREIGIMKYVGATDWFIRWPFILEGMILGAGGALISVLLLYNIYGLMLEQVHQTMAFLPLIARYPFINYISLFLIITGTIIGIAGSAISLRRFLDV